MADYVRGLVWTPAPVLQVRECLHRSTAGQAALVAVESGTVVVPIAEFSKIETGILLNACQKAGGKAVAVRWNPDEWFWPEAVVSRVTRLAKNRGPRLAQALNVPEHVVAPYLAGRPGAANAIGLLEAAGRPDVAAVAGMVETGAFYRYHDRGLVRHKIVSWVVTAVLFLVLAVVSQQFLANVVHTPEWITRSVLPVLAVAAYFMALQLIKTSGVNRRFPIMPDERQLPVVEPPASESQSAKYDANEPRTNNL
jgi:hypothetical protein